MNITMTWSDGFLALLLGIVGSIIASYLYSRSPAVSQVISRWFAQRSQQARADRLLKLEERLKEVQEFEQNQTRYIAWMIKTLSHVQMRNTFALVFFILTGTALTAYAAKPDNTLFIFSFASLGSAFGVLFLAIARGILLADYSNLERAEKELRDEISKIRAMEQPSE
jgi:hypothetical protein